MAQTFDILPTIDGEFCNQEILCRLIHFWEARHFKMGNVLMGYELLLIDSKGNTILAFISANRLFRHESGLKPNSVYNLRRFMIKPAKPLYKTNDHKQRILFTDQTVFIDVPEGANNIDHQKFRIRPFSDFSAIADTETDLFDVLGRIRYVSGDNLRQHAPDGISVQALGIKGTDRVYLHLLMTDGETVRINLWGNLAETFRERWNKVDHQPIALLITTLNPKTIGGNVVTLGSTAATRLFLDIDLAETRELMTRPGSETMLAITPSSAVTKLETLTIHELLQFLENEAPQIASFYCFATIVDVLGQYRWNYISCTGSCKTKLGKTETSMYCTSCKKTNNIGILRYRFEITVRDENQDLATFVVFDDDGIKLTGRKSSELMVVSDKDRDRLTGTVPDCLQGIVGRTCKFQIQLKPYNFSASRQTFTIFRIVDDAADPKPVEETLAIANVEERDHNAKKTDKRVRQSSGVDDASGQNDDPVGAETSQSSLQDANPADNHEGKRPRIQD